MPERLQRRRTKGWRLPEGAVIVSRPSRWGNWFQIGGTYMWLPDATWPIPTSEEPGDYGNGIRVEHIEDAATAVKYFEISLRAQLLLTPDMLVPLTGHDLACWCPIGDDPCHGTVLLELANP